MTFPVRILAALCLLSSGPAVAETLVLTNARVIDGTGAEPQGGRTIVIEDGVIRSISGSDEREMPGGARIVDLGGRTVLPGLIEGHAHLFADELRKGLPTVPEDQERALTALLKTGVTSVREAAGDARLSGELARRQAQGAYEGPRIYYSAVLYGPKFLDDPRAQASQRGLEPGSSPWSRTVTAESDIARVVTDARSTGATGIKIYASIDAETVAALAAEAHRQGLKVWAHSVIFPARPGEVVVAGADSIIHSRGLIAEGREDVPDNFAEGTRTWIRRLDFSGTDPNSKRFTKLFSEMKRHGTIFEPALHADGDPAKGPTGDWRDSMREWSCQITAAAHRAGVTISAGTDTPGRPGALQREMERLVECGLSPLDSIRAATLNNAAALGVEGSYGTVEPGKVADLLVVDGDPALDISAISDVHMVLQDGRVVAQPQANE